MAGGDHQRSKLHYKVKLAHRMPYFSVLGILKYNSLVGQLTKVKPAFLLLLLRMKVKNPNITTLAIMQLDLDD